MPGYFKLINGPSVSDNEGPATPVMTQPEKVIQKTAQKTLPQKRTKPLESTDKNEHIITIETDLYRAEISSIGGGTVKSFQLKKYEEIKYRRINYFSDDDASTAYDKSKQILFSKENQKKKELVR